MTLLWALILTQPQQGLQATQYANYDMNDLATTAETKPSKSRLITWERIHSSSTMQETATVAVKQNKHAQEWQAAKQSYELQVQSLEQVITKQIEQIENLTAQMQAAQQQAQELALRAFQNGTRG